MNFLVSIFLLGVLVNCTSTQVLAPVRPVTSTFEFGVERQANQDDLDLVRIYVDDIARRISVHRSKFFQDVLKKLDLFSVRSVELADSNRSYLMKLQVNDNPRDVWFVNFYYVGRNPQFSHVNGVDERVHQLNDPLVEFPILPIQN